MDKALRYFGIARKAGYLELGEENTGVAVRNGKARVVFLAADASDNAKRRADGFLYGRNIPLLRLPHTKEEISLAMGKGGCSMAAITDIGLASSLVSALATEDPEHYSEAAAELAARNERVQQRKAGAHANERNKKSGKRRTAV